MMNICNSKCKKDVNFFVPGRLYMTTDKSDDDVRICVKVTEGNLTGGYAETLRLFNLKDGRQRNADLMKTEVKYDDVTDDYCLQKVEA